MGQDVPPRRISFSIEISAEGYETFTETWEVDMSKDLVVSKRVRLTPKPKAAPTPTLACGLRASRRLRRPRPHHTDTSHAGRPDLRDHGRAGRSWRNGAHTTAPRIRTRRAA
jgi:hypothetical protein